MVGWVQDHLEAIYQVRSPARVDDYLVDAETAQKLGAQGGTDEELLVCEEGGEMSLALVFSQALRDKVSALDGAPAPALAATDLDAYCQIAEGVSHFVYLTHSAQLSRRVSMLELEAQAEVDKFVTCVLGRWEEGPSFSRDLIGRLFDHVRYRDHLGPELRRRYHEANRLGRSYCSRLLPVIAERKLHRLLSKLRYSYRLGAEAKLQHFSK